MVTALALFTQLAAPAPPAYAFEFRLVKLTPSNVRAMHIDFVAGDHMLRPLRVDDKIIASQLPKLPKSQVVLSPTIVTLDGRPAELFVGDIKRYVESVTENAQGITVKTSEVKVGSTFSVQTATQEDSSVRVALKLQNRELHGFAPNGKAQLPQTSECLLDCPVSMKVGQTIAFTGFLGAEQERTSARTVLFVTLRKP